MPAETETARKYHIVGDYATALNPRNDARSVEKYARHWVLRPHGARIQRALCAARVLVVTASSSAPIARVVSPLASGPRVVGRSFDRASLVVAT